VVSPGATTVAVDKVNAAAGGTISVPVDVSPGAGSAVWSLNLSASYDGNQ